MNMDHENLIPPDDLLEHEPGYWDQEYEPCKECGASIHLGPGLIPLCVECYIKKNGGLT